MLKILILLLYGRKTRDFQPRILYFLSKCSDKKTFSDSLKFRGQLLPSPATGEDNCVHIRWFGSELQTSPLRTVVAS